MAQLKDTVISGSLRVTDTTYTTTADVYALRVPTSSGSTAHGVGTAGNILHSNGTASYWGAMTSGELPAHTHPYLPNTDVYTSATYNTNVGVDSTVVKNVVGYVNGLTKAAWNRQQVDGAIYKQTYSSAWIHEIFGDYRTGRIATRGRNNGTWQDWKIILDSDDIKTTTALGGAGGTGASSITSKIYAVQKDSADDLAVYVPWTDTDTKVTSVGNHYTPTSSGTFSPAAGGTTTDISTSVLNIITGLQKDAAGHITGVVSGSIKATNTPNTDEKLKMTPASVTKFYPAGNPNSTSAVTTAYYSTAVSITGATVSGGTFSGNKVHANVANSGSDGGVALYSTVVSDYGLAMRQTANSGKHGGVQGDWAIYNWMAGATNRGFIWKNSSTAVASIDCAGNEVLNGSLTVGGNSANNTGCKMQFNSTTKSLDFVFA